MQNSKLPIPRVLSIVDEVQVELDSARRIPTEEEWRETLKNHCGQNPPAAASGSKIVLDEKDIKILKSLNEHTHALLITDLAVNSGLDRKTCTPRLKALHDCGYVTQKPGKPRSGYSISDKGKAALIPR